MNDENNQRTIVDLPNGHRLIIEGDRRFIVPPNIPAIIVIPDVILENIQE